MPDHLIARQIRTSQNPRDGWIPRSLPPPGAETVVLIVATGSSDYPLAMWEASEIAGMVLLGIMVIGFIAVVISTRGPD
ncbi:MAG TPA: hypothetical protein VI386_20645 [Candidatus Sulfotelmatobacter sp.]